MRPVVSDADIREAAARLHGVAVLTTLVPFPGLSAAEHQTLLIKPESLQPVGSFKLRGAYNAISARPESDRDRGVVAHSSGNHGLAVAYAARRLGVTAVIVVPENAPLVKTDAIRACGAELVTVAPTLAARLQAAQELVDRHGYTLIPPFDHPQVIAGQGTIGLEIMASQPDTDLILVPVSGGGLIAGIATAAHSVNPDVTVIGVEPELAADARDSLAKGERVAWPASSVQRTVADALRVEQVGELPFGLMREHVAGIVTVTDEQILAAVRELALTARLVAEPGGAAAAAAWLFRRADLPAARRPVAVLSGGNIDPALLARAIGGIGRGTGTPEPARH
ncbi:MAG TPA: threonine/serine dehydratase [Streptosporangiaceae bacterium]|nr:threonine/serine dehydratase [Streptosporangiaceae bacterium]